MGNGKPSSNLEDQGLSRVAVEIAVDVADIAALTTAARGRVAEGELSSVPCLDRREVTLPVTSLLSTETGTLSPKISLMREILEEKGRWVLSTEVSDSPLADSALSPMDEDPLATCPHVPGPPGKCGSSREACNSSKWRVLAIRSLGVRGTAKPGGGSMAWLSVDGVLNGRGCASKSERWATSSGTSRFRALAW